MYCSVISLWITILSLRKHRCYYTTVPVVISLFLSLSYCWWHAENSCWWWPGGRVPKPPDPSEWLTWPTAKSHELYLNLTWFTTSWLNIVCIKLESIYLKYHVLILVLRYEVIRGRDGNTCEQGGVVSVSVGLSWAREVYTDYLEFVINFSKFIYLL